MKLKNDYYPKFDNNYILKDKQPVKDVDFKSWCTWYEEATKNGERIVQKDKIGDITISTVFLGFDHGLDDGTPGYAPILFETMIFGGPHDGYQERYRTWDEAVEGHKKALGSS